MSDQVKAQYVVKWNDGTYLGTEGDEVDRLVDAARFDSVAEAWVEMVECGYSYDCDPRVLRLKPKAAAGRTLCGYAMSDGCDGVADLHSIREWKRMTPWEQAQYFPIYR